MGQEGFSIREIDNLLSLARQRVSYGISTDLLMTVVWNVQKAHTWFQFQFLFLDIEPPSVKNSWHWLEMIESKLSQFLFY